ncbi:hypothetical protein EYM_03670 [Ignicoccus islandicus DSM 13165]|uniref:ASCH domain-containing protein n=1 Tax=Ignicoccus islandicus DSM 13165 TaxID=940295 RepID=A0A0U2WL62_9CREN|nr:ASCH domain-containing protein [Ignicoccus islandicus]ALU11681.1 hypothetical protein EYM_03670 [Ignicoccus islandicus DSM 13165]
MIVKYEGNNSYIAFSKDFKISVNTPGGTFFISLVDNEEAHYCPRGVRCKNPTEGWIDLFRFSVAIFPEGLVLVDEKTSVGIGRIPPSIHVDMLISNFNEPEHKCFQTIELLDAGEYVDPFKCMIYSPTLVHEMKLEPQWFELISKEEKTVEVRLLDEKRKKLRVGHVIKFVNTQNSKELYARITSLRVYDNIKKLLELEDLTRVMPGYDYMESLEVYKKYYDVESRKAIAIGLEVL